jgi:alpha-D-ribose 1-methylphosphonate 5-triphosphate synthase subunit PhnG
MHSRLMVLLEGGLVGNQPFRFSWKQLTVRSHSYLFETPQSTSKMKESGPAEKRAREGDGGGETKALITSTGEPQKHEISLNISGVTLGHSQARDHDDETAKLREVVEAILAQARTVHGEITKVREDMDAKNRNEAQAIRDEIVKLNSKLELQNSKLELQNSKLDVQTKMQTLGVAVQNVEANSFQYGDSTAITPPEGYAQTRSSRDLARTILLSFQRGYAFRLPYDRGTLLISQDVEKNQQAFRDKLSVQIHELTGVKPQFVLKKEQNEYWVNYS